MGIPNVNLKYQQQVRMEGAPIDPSQALTSLVQENELLKKQNAALADQSEKLGVAYRKGEERLKALEEFAHIIEQPIPELVITLKDKYIIDQLRGMMVKIWGPDGELDMHGGFAQTMVNRKLELLMTEVIRFGREHFHQIPGRIRIAEGVAPNGTAGEMAQVGNPTTH